MNYELITQASILAKNETDPTIVQNTDVSNANNTLDKDCDNVEVVVNNNNITDCNDTKVQKADVQIQNCDTIEAQIECTNANVIENNTEIQNCAHNDQEVDKNCKSNTKNEIPNSDTILKYVYKKSDKVKDNNKSTGHEKNSLKRRKRSLASGINNELLNLEQKAPLIVNYETSHGNRHEQSSPIRNAEKNIKSSALADFNIETLHANNKKTHPQRNSKHSSRGNYNPPPPNVEEKRNRQENSIPRKSSEDNSSENSASSEESGEHIKNRAVYQNPPTNRENNNENSDESQESKENRENFNKAHYSDNAVSAESKESAEQIDSKEKTSKYSKSLEQSEESNERDIKPRDKQQYSNDDHKSEEYKNNPQTFVENSNESSEEEKTRKSSSPDEYKNALKENKNSEQAIQDVGLEDFSYERIQVNAKGEVEPAKDTHQNISSEPIVLQTTTKPTADLKTYNEEKTASIESDETSGSIEKDQSSEPVNINDGEVKPVVEINRDADSIELSEKNTEGSSKSDNENESLETLLGVNIPDNNHNDEESSKIIGNKPDVKQEFERIPTDYKHDNKKQSEENESVKPSVIENKNSNSNNDEGTLDVFKSKDENFDENLKIKFADVTVKLPEIKLPDDVLDYAQSNNDDTDDEPAYYGYYDDRNEKQAYKKEDDSEEDEDEEEDDDDLYEKFVRERFGKRGSFQKRSEKLQDINSKPHNPQLYATIKNILKKTEQVRKEAETSGDPKAGYAWTLEYGENA
ncbi:probable serine/threonine-protein kinase DDB_G0282963 [Manduca sexta]|uniref:probable serine/threonine-protein kinase DDB_G0282963 n=1 Tax=Manduca sexta TaxID=7130 RepID=UPI0018906CEB|nr:probable serine/threonine-protein kinase DDB_G0282963 [Manduca sexta]